MYKLIINIHIFTSVLFIVISLLLTIKSLLGWKKSLEFTKTDNKLTISFIVLLYVSLLIGTFLYFFIDAENKIPKENAMQAINYFSMKFWSIEHFSVMTFALILSQIGRIFIEKTANHKSKHGYTLFYFGMATVFTLISMTFYIYDKIKNLS